jgi:hypothetical protein
VFPQIPDTPQTHAFWARGAQGASLCIGADYWRPVAIGGGGESLQFVH